MIPSSVYHITETISRPDIFVLGFQEIVPLTAQQIVQTDPEKRFVHVPYADQESQSIYALGVCGKAPLRQHYRNGRGRHANTCSSEANRYASAAHRLSCAHGRQLVGTAIMLFVKTSLASIIRNVEATTRKVRLVYEPLL